MKQERLPWLLLALAGTAALSAFGGAPDEAVRAADAFATAERLPIIRALAARNYAPALRGDPFAAASLPGATGEAAAGDPSAVPPAPSLAPSLPWRVLGKQRDDDEGWSVFLARGEETWVVRSGDTLDDNYRVISIAPPALILLHLKQKTRSTLDIGVARE